MTCAYKLNDNLLERNAANLVFSLKEINSSIFLYRENERRVNGKSLIGILSSHFIQGETIKILIDNSEELTRIKEIFNEVGTEVPQEAI